MGLALKRLLRVGLAVLAGDQAAEVMGTGPLVEASLIAGLAGAGRYLRHKFPLRFWTRILPF